MKISDSLYEQILVDSGVCYYLDSTTVYARDLHSGAEKWHVPATMGSLEGLGLAEGALILFDSGGPEVAGIGGPAFGLVALDPATGRQMWKNTQTSVITVRGPHVYVYSEILPSLKATATKNSVQALDSATGRVLWTYDSPVSSALVVSIATGQNGGDTTWAADDFLIFPYAPGNDFVSTGEGGFLVLDAKTGKLIWAHQGSPDAQDNQASWPAATSGNMVYAASTTTLYAFEVSR